MVTAPYRDTELPGLSEPDRFYAMHLKREKAIGEESIGIFSAESLGDLATVLARQVNKHHPTPLIILDTNDFRESFIFKSVDMEDRSGIRERIAFVRGRKEIVFEKKCQVWREMGVESIIELEKFCQDKMREAGRLGLKSPRKYMMEALTNKYPGSAEYFKDYGLQLTLRIKMADPRSQILYRLIGKERERMINAATYYEKLHCLAGVAHASNEIVEMWGG